MSLVGRLPDTAEKIVVCCDAEAIQIDNDIPDRICRPISLVLRRRGYLTTPMSEPAAARLQVPHAISEAEAYAEKSGEDEKSQHFVIPYPPPLRNNLNN